MNIHAETPSARGGQPEAASAPVASDRLQAVAAGRDVPSEVHPEVREEICTRLNRKGFAVLAAANGPTALRILAGRPDIGALLTDLRMPGMDGLALAQAALAGRGATDAIEILLVSGYITPAYSMAAERIGAFGMMSKPLRGSRLTALVEDALESAGHRRRIALGLAPDATGQPQTPAPASASQSSGR
jgi:DNA-binding NtrC family response regulator